MSVCFFAVYVVGVLALLNSCRGLSLVWPIIAIAQMIDAVEKEVETRNSRRE